jgi:hypothetical protein
MRLPRGSPPRQERDHRPCSAQSSCSPRTHADRVTGSASIRHAAPRHDPKRDKDPDGQSHASGSGGGRRDGYLPPFIDSGRWGPRCSGRAGADWGSMWSGNIETSAVRPGMSDAGRDTDCAAGCGRLGLGLDTARSSGPGSSPSRAGGVSRPCRASTDET